MVTTQPARYCDRCGGRLARDNNASRCSACRSVRDVLLGPPSMPREFWDTDQMRDALATWHIGRVIYAYRTHPWHPRLLSQEVVGNWLGLTQAQLSRIENGRAPEELTKLVRWAQILGVPGELLWFDLPNEQRAEARLRVSPPRTATLPAVVSRPPVMLPVNAEVGSASRPVGLVDELAAPDCGRALDSSAHELPTGSEAGRGVTKSEAAERMSYMLTHPSSADLITVAHLRQQVQQLDEQYVLVPSTVLLAHAGQYLGQVRFLATHAVRSRVRRDLYAVEAEAAILMGQLVWDASQRRDHASARMYLDQAIDAARKVRDPAGEGLALLRKSMIALYGERNPRDGLALARQTAETTERASDVLAGLAQLHAAEAHAMLGERAPCEVALATADRQLGHVREMDAAIDLYSDTQFGRMAGSCYLFLEDTSRAQVLLETTAVSLTDHSKSQAIVLGNLTLALIRQGNLDEAAGRLHQAIDVIELNWGGGGLNIIFGAGRELRPWRTVPVVQDVYDRLLTLMAG